MQNKQGLIQVQATMPQTIMSRELLQMPTILLHGFLSAAIIDNPFLELRYAMIEKMIAELPCSSVKRKQSNTENLGPAGAQLSLLEELCGEQKGSLYENLQFQASLVDLSNQNRKYLNYLIGLINEDGYFQENVPELAKELEISSDRVLQLLKIIQGFYPPGIGARNLQECLMLQVDPNSPCANVMKQMIAEDLSRVAQHNFTALRRKYHLTDLQLQKLIGEIQRLNPRPGLLLKTEPVTQYVYPEASISIVDDFLELEMRNETESILLFNRNYMQDIEDAEAQAYLRQKKTEAVNLINSLNMRQTIIRQMLLYLMKEQKEFFFGGQTHLKPLSMKEAADALGVHPSTITRCVKDKYIETPQGVVALKQFFQFSSGNEELSAKHVRQLIMQLINGECKASPLSDSEISVRLKKNGIALSRRTVSKYRQRLRIPCQRERRKYQ